MAAERSRELAGTVVHPQVAALTPVVGRQAELTQLRESFLTLPAPAVQVLTGMGGVGKTSLARAYAQRHRGDYGVIWWVRAEDPATVDAEFRSLLEVLLPAGEAATISNAHAAACAVLAQRDDPWLLVLDNVPDAEAAQSLLPPGGHVLITSRATRWPNTTTTVRPLDTDMAVELLTSCSRDPDRIAAKAIATELGGLPLALTQAAGFVRASAIDLSTYLRLYRSTDLHGDGRPIDYPHTIVTTWRLVMDRLSESARTLLNVMAFYAPDAIPVQLFSSMDELARIRAIEELLAYSLTTPAGPKLVTVHRLVQRVTRSQLSERKDEWADRARELIMAAMPQEPATSINLAVWNDLRTHVRALLEHLPAEHPDTLAIRDTAALWTGLAGNAAEARDQFAELYFIRERVLGAEHPDTVRNLERLSSWTGAAGDAVRAGRLSVELLAIRERAKGTEHPDTLSTWNNVAMWVGQTGEVAWARSILAKLLATQKRVLGAEHRDTLTTWMNLTHWTGFAGDAAGARDLFAEQLPIHERVLGAEHPDTLRTRHNLAGWIGEAGDPAQARNMLAELVPILARVLGNDHRETQATCATLAHWTNHD